MNNTKYYYDYLDGNRGGVFYVESDEKALERVKNFEGKIILYKESDMPDGTSFITLRKDS